MATQNPRVWFKSISLENVRSFGTKQTINFTDNDGKAARWNVILGDNGTGKTTVLNSLLMAEPDFESHSKLEQAFRLKMLPISIITDRERIHKDGTCDSLSSETTFNWHSKKNEFTKRWKLLNSTDTAEYWHMIFAYPATRYISEATILKENNSLFDVFIDGREELINAEEWLIQADYLSLKDEQYKERFTLVRGILLKLFRMQVDDIYINVDAGIPKVYFKTYYGDVRIHELSLGYKTLIAWMVDFAKGLLDWHPDSLDPLAEPAVCLVDELDLHLHPKFQRTIIQFLTETFPNTQFIVTAHSPLIVQSAEDANIIVLRREGNETVVESDRVNVHDWRIDQILSSDLFGGISSRAPQVEEKMSRRRSLLRKDERSPDEQHELDNLEKELGELPVMETREALKAIDIISKAIINEGQP